MFFLAFQAQHTFKSLEDGKKLKHIRDSQTTKLAVIKLLKITVFIVKMHLAHTTTYEDHVRFVGNELEEPVLKKYLQSVENCKNESYLLTTALNTFLNLISNWMKDNTMKIVREHEDFTIMLNEATDESNR